VSEAKAAFDAVARRLLDVVPRARGGSAMRSVWRNVLCLGALCVVGSACGVERGRESLGANGGGAGASSGGGNTGGSGGSSSGGSRAPVDGGGFGSFGDAAVSPPANEGCSGAATNFVYVLSIENDLYRFAPRAKLFSKIGRLGCRTTLTPNSMAVDHNAVAWVNYYDPSGSSQSGVLFRVSTADASCEASPAMTLPPTFFHVGMGFSTDFANPASETLYLAADNQGQNNRYLGKVAATGAVTSLALFSPTQTYQTLDAELTGTGDGRLFAFFISLMPGVPGQPMYPSVGLVDKTTAAVQSPATMTGVKQPLDWAFSFWGGHFYLYTSQGPGSGNGSDVTDYDPASGAVDSSYMTGIGFDIVGAGVSTCAPTTAAQ
jgi:hypothetical protein